MIFGAGRKTAAEEVRDERDLRTDGERRPGLPFDALDVGLPDRRVVGVCGIGGNMSAGVGRLVDHGAFEVMNAVRNRVDRLGAGRGDRDPEKGRHEYDPAGRGYRRNKRVTQVRDVSCLPIPNRSDGHGRRRQAAAAERPYPAGGIS